VSPEIVLWNTPPDPALPEELHGVNALLSVGVHAGDPSDADAALRPLTTLAAPVLDMSGTMPYVAVQSSLDALAPPGGRYYFKSHFMDALTDEAIATLVACDRRRPASRALTVIRTLGGAIDRVREEDSAFAHRRARFNLSMDGLWQDEADDAAVIGWVRETWARMRPFGTGGVYLNFAGFDDEPDVSASATMGRAARRLDKVRAKYDPEGLFAPAVRA
jgi:hypothetical protein